VQVQGTARHSTVQQGTARYSKVHQGTTRYSKGTTMRTTSLASSTSSCGSCPDSAGRSLRTRGYGPGLRVGLIVEIDCTAGAGVKRCDGVCVSISCVCVSVSVCSWNGSPNPSCLQRLSSPLRHTVQQQGTARHSKEQHGTARYSTLQQGTAIL
jgi:hypothetical protein